jgi:hypothetical protein
MQIHRAKLKKSSQVAGLKKMEKDAQSIVLEFGMVKGFFCSYREV